jgi:type I restriction enzyme S subunit
MSEMVPEDWEVKSLSKDIQIMSGFPFQSAFFSLDSSKIGLIRIRNLVGQKVDTFYEGEYSSDFLVKKGDFLIGMDGDFTIVKWQSGQAFLNQRICKIYLKNDKHFDLDYLYYILSVELERIHNKTGATTVKHLSVKDIREIRRHFPPLPEQQKIASILTTVDEVIEKTESQISKLQDLKKGMVQELWTQGIGHTQYKDSPVGKIPASWKAFSLGVLCKFTQGVQIPYSDMVRRHKNGYIRYLYIRDFMDDKSLYFVKNIYGNKIVKITDLVMANTGHTAGKVFWGKDGVLSNNAFRISMDTSRINYRFLYHFLCSDFYKKEIGKLFNTAGQPHVGHGNIARLQVGLPHLKEQILIAKIIDSIDTNIQTKQQKLQQTKNLKKSLMQDLLTGKVRVEVD